MTAKAWAVIPAKCFARGKSRLAPVLSEGARAELSRGFLEHVLGVCAEAASLEGVVVATECDEVAAVARDHGALVFTVPREGEGRLAQIVDAALRDLAGRGAERAVVLMSDLPLLAAGDVDAVVGLLEGAGHVLAPDTRDEGTNALAVHLDPARRLPTRFGTVGSFALHGSAFAEAGSSVAVYRSARVALDIDTPDDLAVYDEACATSPRLAAGSALTPFASSPLRLCPGSLAGHGIGNARLA